MTSFSHHWPPSSFCSNKIYFPKEESSPDSNIIVYILGLLVELLHSFHGSSPDSSIIVYILGLLVELLHSFHGKGGALETIHFQPGQRNVQIFRNAVTVRQQKHSYRCSIPLSWRHLCFCKILKNGWGKCIPWEASRWRGGRTIWSWLYKSMHH